jgi:hypothetical protein
MIDLALIDALTGGRLGEFRVVCPVCGPSRSTVQKRRRKVLKIWRNKPGFASYACGHCCIGGYAADADELAQMDPQKLARLKAEAAERDRTATAKRLQTASWLWWQRQPLAGTDGETYLREIRGYSGPLPGTLGFLPARGEHPSAMIAAFGLAIEPEPGVIQMRDQDLRGVHITRLAPGGRGKAGTECDKVMIGRSLGSPIVLAPLNDLLGLTICEGIEDCLSVHEATGLGAWAAGSAARLPALADALPSYIDSLTVMVDADRDGRRYAGELVELIQRRDIEVRSVLLPQEGVAA